MIRTLPSSTPAASSSPPRRKPSRPSSKSPSLKKEGQVKKLILTGCLTERYKEEAANEFPEADAIVGIGDNKDIVDILDKVLAGERWVHFAPKADVELSGGRIISTLPFFSYLKISEGCSNCCTYCAIPMIRGKYRSVPMEDVLAEAKWLTDNGVTELNIIAQDTTRYGEDLYGENKLCELLHKLCEIPSLAGSACSTAIRSASRTSSSKPLPASRRSSSTSICPSSTAMTRSSKRMNRPSTKAKLLDVIGRLRAKMPDIVLRTTLIAGFPGETEEQFTELCEFVKDVKFARLGCFAYSQEDGTKAAELPGQLDDDVKQNRADILMEHQMDIAADYNAAQIGTEKTAVVEGFDKWAECYFGRTAADAPDIDGKVFFSSERQLQVGDYVQIRITDMLDYDLLGEVIA